MYDPKFSQKQMYDQYGSSLKSSNKKADPKPSRSSGFGGMGADPAEQFGRSPTRGIGAKPPSFGGGQDNNPNRDESENKSTVAKVYEKTVDLLKSFGAKEPEALIVDGKRVYQGPAFRGYDPTTRTGEFGGEYGKKNYFLGMESFPTYPRTDVSPTLPPSTINVFGVNRDNPRLNMFGVNRSFTQPPDSPELPTSPDVPANMDPLTRGLSQAMLPVPDVPTAKYKIQLGDTLSEIADATGSTVEELARINNIKEVDVIKAGADIDIPIRRDEDAEVVTQATSIEELKPIKASYSLALALPPLKPNIKTDYTDDDLGIPTGPVPDYTFMLPGSKFTEALKAKEADNYDTLFGNAESFDTPFNNKKVSEMTVKEVLEFTKLNGPFHKFNKKKGFNTTAVGKYQIVGSTLRDLNSKDRQVLKKLGITGDTKFDQKTQDDIAAYLAVHRIKDRATKGDGNIATRAQARKEMRNEWQGFQKLSDRDLDDIIDEISREVGVSIVETRPSSSLRPKVRPKGLGAK